MDLYYSYFTLGKNAVDNVDLNLKFEEVQNEIKALDMDSKLSKVVDAVCKSLRSPDMDKRFTKITDEVGQAIRAASEIINSVEDLKQMTSSIPGACYELGPKIEKNSDLIESSQEIICNKLISMQNDVIKECCLVVSTTHQESFDHIMSKFDLVENRFGVIRKYCKLLPEALQMG